MDDLVNGLRLSCRLWIRDIHNVQEEGGLGDLLQGGAEGGNKLGRKLLDKPHRIGDEHLGSPPRPSAHTDPSNRRRWMEGRARTSFPLSSTILLVVGSRVANSLSSASVFASAIRLMSVDLPTFV